jgi:hypothetical protein
VLDDVIDKAVILVIDAEGPIPTDDRQPFVPLVPDAPKNVPGDLGACASAETSAALATVAPSRAASPESADMAALRAFIGFTLVTGASGAIA